MKAKINITKGLRNCRLFYTHLFHNLKPLHRLFNCVDNVGITESKILILWFDNDFVHWLSEPKKMPFYHIAAHVEMLYSIGNIDNYIESLDLGVQHTHFETIEEFISEVGYYYFEDQEILICADTVSRTNTLVNLLEEKTHQTILETSAEAVKHNVKHFRKLLPATTKMLAMVKANGYGGGSTELAHILEMADVDYLGVAYTDEGVELREAGIAKPIFVMNPSIASFPKILIYDLEAEIFNFTGLEQFIKLLKESKTKQYPIHIKFDTGMSRLGFSATDIPQLIEILSSNPCVKVQSVLSHLTSTDDPADDDFTRLQIEKFKTIAAEMEQKLGYTVIKHLCNSMGVERFPEAHFDMVRIGIGLHGISSIQPNPLKYSETLKTRIAQIRTIEAHQTVGYNRRGKLTQTSQIATIAIGYADGLHRRFGNERINVLVNGKKAPIIGNVCMDMCMVDVSGIEAHEGDEVIIFGNYSDEINLQQLAKVANTITYEILTSISARVKHIYTYE